MAYSVNLLNYVNCKRSTTYRARDYTSNLTKGSYNTAAADPSRSSLMVLIDY